MNTILLTVVALAVVIMVASWGVRAGYNLRQREFERAFAAYMNARAPTQTEVTFPEVSMVKEGSSFYVYDIESDQFLGQGKTHEEVLRSIAANHPGKAFSISADTVRRMQEVGYK